MYAYCCPLHACILLFQFALVLNGAFWIVVVEGSSTSASTSSLCSAAVDAMDELDSLILDQNNNTLHLSYRDKILPLLQILDAHCGSHAGNAQQQKQSWTQTIFPPPMFSASTPSTPLLQSPSKLSRHLPQHLHNELLQQQMQPQNKLQRRTATDNDLPHAAGYLYCSLKFLMDATTSNSNCVPKNISGFRLEVNIAFLHENDPDKFDFALQTLREIASIQDVTYLIIVVGIPEWEQTVFNLLTHVSWINIQGLYILGESTDVGGGGFLNHTFQHFAQLEMMIVEDLELFIEEDAFAPAPNNGLKNLQLLRTLTIFNCALRRLEGNVFRSISNLIYLSLESNNIEELPPTLFYGLTLLQALRLQSNQISAIPPGCFLKQALLESLDISSNDLFSVPSDLLDSLPMLTTLRLSNNHISSLNSLNFASTPKIVFLDASFNALTSLSSNLLHPLAALGELRIHNNQIEFLPETTFAQSRNLQNVSLDNNHLRTLHPNVFHGVPHLVEIYLDNNFIETLPEGIFDSLPDLVRLNIDNNRIRYLQSGLLKNLSSLTRLRIDNNLLTELPNGFLSNLTNLKKLFMNSNGFRRLDLDLFSACTFLEDLWLHDNQLTILSEALFAPLTNLKILLLSGNMGLHFQFSILNPSRLSLEELEIEKISSATVDEGIIFPALKELYMGELQVIGNVRGFFEQQGRVSNLTHLAVGWTELDESVVPFYILCEMLSSSGVSLFSVSSSSYTTMSVCTSKSVDAVQLNANKMLLSVHSSSHNLLSVANSPRLRLLDIHIVNIVDVSSTNLPYSSQFCLSVGGSAFFAQNMNHLSFQLRSQQLLSNCFRHGNVFDFSQNEWLSNLALINRAAPSRVVLGKNVLQRTDRFADTFRTALFREDVPVIILDGTAIQCSVSFELVNLFLSARTVPTFSFHCACSNGHRQRGDICVSTALGDGEIAGIAIGVTWVVLGVVLLFVWKWYQNKKREKYQLLLEQEQLYGLEIDSLKQGWQIDLNELDLIVKVDEGAFGEVWRAQWDGVVVAVKFLKYASMGTMDACMLNDFEKEVDFLRRTRHPHLVRFFGTGIDNHGAPFLVLEFVDLGSLKHILHERGLDDVLKRYHNENHTETNESTSSFDIVSVDDLKLSLVHGVAKGMSFLHSLGVVHRDLKSGNVLVTKRFVAKITDFGSMSGKLGELSNNETAEGNEKQSKQKTPSSSSNKNRNEDSDIDRALTDTMESKLNTLQYCPNTATRTVGVTMTTGVGTPLYMAPEVIDAMNKRLTLKTDVFSFGILMWEVHMCKIPDLVEQEYGSEFLGFIMPTLLQLYRRGKTLQFNGTAPEWYENLCYACMSFTPLQRPSFDSVLEVIDASLGSS
eukprot:m.119435 g.119435  ORF g.119435 m.119435 type:complete len:1357 (+) comp9357_c1_seq2:161-4231(+)